MPLALVTGGSSGIGAALVKELAKSGCHVIAVARRESKLEAVAKEAAGDSVTVVPADVATDEGRSRIAAAVKDKTIDFLVHNAGGMVLCKFTAPRRIADPLHRSPRPRETQGN